MTDLTPLENAPRLLVEAALRPVQTGRFQPTGFPDLGPATYTTPDGTEMLIVESVQSMANRLESVCWDEAAGELVAPLRGLPYLHVDIHDQERIVGTTASVLEAHRLNSPYVLGGAVNGSSFEQVFLDAAGAQAGQPVDRRRFIEAVLKYDVGALLHGAFLSNVGDGRLRLARVLSAFIEARNVRPVASGGVKNDRINPSGDTAAGFGNVPFARTEFTAETITAFFNLDLRQLRSFGLAAEVVRLLQLLGFYKIARLLRDGLRLRTACDLECGEIRVTAPVGFAFPELRTLEGQVAEAVKACARHFAQPPVTRLRFQTTAQSAKASRKAAKEKEAEAAGDKEAEAKGRGRGRKS